MPINQVCLSIMEPSGAGNRLRIFDSLVGRDQTPTVNEVKKRLAQIQRSSLDNHSCLALKRMEDSLVNLVSMWEAAERLPDLTARSFAG